MRKVLFNIRTAGEHPSLDWICRTYGFRVEDIDEEFGVIEVDDVEHVFAIRVDEEASARVDPRWRGDLEGPFSDPKIDVFGPPEP